ncbi:DUF1232 domain-containing protein, partial [Streptomyces nodosus]
PTGPRWIFWGAVLYLLLPTDLLPDPVYLDDRTAGDSAQLQLQPLQDLGGDRVGDVGELLVSLQELGDIGADRHDPSAGLPHIGQRLLNQL